MYTDSGLCPVLPRVRFLAPRVLYRAPYLKAIHSVAIHLVMTVPSIVPVAGVDS